MKLAIIGTGYVGLVTGACLAELGHEVICMDKNTDKIKKIQQGKMPIYEKDLPELVQKNINRNLLFTTDLKAVFQHTHIVFLALPTPALPDGRADLSLVFQFIDEMILHIHREIVLITKSTVPVGTAKQIQAILDKYVEDKNLPICEVVSNPEFLREGFAVQDALNPTRIVVGTQISSANNERIRQLMSDIYTPYLSKNIPILFMDDVSAELSKYAANSFLATKISFINQLANFAEKIGANIQDVASVMGEDPRIGKQFLNAGCGYGGSCLPKDVKALIHAGHDNNINLSIIQAVDEVNELQKMKLINEIVGYYNGNIRDKVFALWGLSFKPYTDDIREAPAFAMINELLKLGAKVKAFDFQAMDNTFTILKDQIAYGKDMYHTLEGTDALIIATEWSDFKKANLSKIAILLEDKIIFDGRNLFEREDAQSAGLKYFSIGRQSV